LASSSSPSHQATPSKQAVAARSEAAAVRHDREVLRFFRQHRWLLSDPRFSAEAHRQIARRRADLAHALAREQARATALRRKRVSRRLAVAKVETPQAVICRVFGSYCGQALQVARCESRFNQNAQNGQYLGLFQMGTSERRIFGHGPSAEEQARAAYRYFVASGKDWSPWQCKPW
jgi:hypothetical protein